jgi:glutamate--cysteine ligase
MEDWELHLSAIFTEVRSYSYIEIRSADMQPAGKITAVPALYTGLLYDSGNLGQVLELCAGHDRHEAWREAMDSAARSGLDGTAGGRPIRELAERIVALALEGLERNPEHAGDPERAGRVLLDLAEDHGLDPGAAAGSGR